MLIVQFVAAPPLLPRLYDFSNFDPRNFINPINPIDTINPINPINPINLINPINPINPMNPINPINPMNPINLINPMNPINPLNPINPINPNTHWLGYNVIKILYNAGETISKAIGAFSVYFLRISPKMGVRWPILALVGVGIARKRPGERFGTVVDGVDFGRFSDF